MPKRPKPMATFTDAASTRGVIFGPNEEVVAFLGEGRWGIYAPGRRGVRVVELGGTHAAFFGSWLLVRDAIMKRTTAFAWPSLERVSDCEIDFDHGYAYYPGTSLVTTSPQLAAFVAGGVLWLRHGSPDTINDGRGWSTVTGQLSNSNVRLLLGAGIVVGMGAGTAIDIVDVAAKAISTRSLDGHVDGHPIWAAMHPMKNKVAIFSRWTVVHDIDGDQTFRLLWLPTKSAGEYLPDGRLLVSSELGMLLLDGHYTRLLAVAGWAENEPLRVSPRGTFVVLPGTPMTVFRVADIVAG